MSDRFWQRLSYLSGIAALGVFFGLAVFLAGIEVKDLDLWLHLKTGQIIAETGSVPSVDIFSSTIAGKPWINHEWLFQVLVHYVHQFFGFDGLITMQVWVVTLTLALLLFLGYSRERQWLVVFTLLLVLLVYKTRFTIRPDIFSLLFFVLYVHLCSAHIHKRWFLPALVLIQVVWTNMHGFFFFGPLLVGIGIFAEFLKRRVLLPFEWNTVARLTDEEYRRLRWAGLAVLLACCVNPLGIKGALYPLVVLGQLGNGAGVFFKHITELQKPIAWNTLLTLQYFPYKMLILLSALSFVFNRRRVDVSVFLLWIAFLLFSLTAIRNMVFFAAAAYLVFAANAAQVVWDYVTPLRFTHPRFKSMTGIILKITLLMWMLNLGLAVATNGDFDFDTYERKSEFGGLSKRSYQYKAVDFLVANGVKGDFFNDFNSGAYLIGRAYPNVKVFIDGRTELYGSDFFERYQKVWKQGDLKMFREMDVKRNITGAFLNNNNQDIPRKVLKMFARMPGWRVVYFDDDAVIFLKETPVHKPLITKFAVDLNKWDPEPMDLSKLGPKRIDPFPFVSRAYLLESLGMDGPALKEVACALQVSPDHPGAYRLWGKIDARRRDYRKAFEHFRMAVMLFPGDRQSRMGLANAYEHLGDRQGALRQYERLLADKPNDVRIADKVRKLKERLKKKK